MIRKIGIILGGLFLIFAVTACEKKEPEKIKKRPLP